MKQSICLAMFAVCITICHYSRAQDTRTFGSSAFGKGSHVVGGHLLLGGGGIMEDSDSPEYRARFTGGVGFYYRYYFTDNLALNAGLDFIGKGGRYDAEVEVLGFESEHKTYFRCMEFPLGVVFEPIPNLQVGGALVLAFTLGGKDKYDNNDGVTVEATFGDNEWDIYRRFNIAPRLFASYGIPVGPIVIVPGLMWEMDIINVYKGEYDRRIRTENLMITAGVQYGL